LVTGSFFLLTFIHVLILPLYDDILNDPEFILGEGDALLVKLGALSDLITGLAGIATGVLFFQVLRRQNVALSLGYVGIRVFEAAIIVVGTVCLLGIVTVREELGAEVAANPDAYTAVANSLVAVRDWTFFFGPGVCSGVGNGLLLGFLVLRSGLMPRNLALFGVIGGPLSLIGLVFVLFGQWEQADPPQFLFTLPEIIWELGLSIYLIVKGFKPIPIATDASLSSD
jgi:hypothetical protein